MAIQAVSGVGREEQQSEEAALSLLAQTEERMFLRGTES